MPKGSPSSIQVFPGECRGAGTYIYRNPQDPLDRRDRSPPDQRTQATAGAISLDPGAFRSRTDRHIRIRREGEETPTSDIDILVEFAPEQATFQNFMDLIAYLEDLFGRRVDPVTTGGIDPYLRSYIKGEAVWCEA
ncbi:nucleotidyltransferase family protein [Methanofollis sp.]|uniref:nucleotidyltransferase family protein n=1 Tax=Methanofollis sp. TaxID=2052835 RepID=UPI00345B1063